MTLLLRKANAQAALEGRAQGCADTDYHVLDDERVVGPIYQKMLSGKPKWRWFVNLSPDQAPPPNAGVEDTLDDAKTAFKKRYETITAPIAESRLAPRSEGLISPLRGRCGCYPP